MIIKLIVSLVIPLLIGFLGSLATQSSISSWYVTLNKPLLNPPSWVFAPVWSLLYIMIGINLYLLWQKFLAKKIDKKTFQLFIIQIVLNGLWSPIFFGLKSPFFSLIIILSLLITLIMIAKQLYQKHKLNFYLLLPYIAWVSFASYLNLGIFILNL